ncbi:MAG: type I methionyl aminopeptidase [Anaerolineaceae bacterium]|nr:type I methionyl aminopeptidase [Anaerolineaceae bacterium]
MSWGRQISIKKRSDLDKMRIAGRINAEALAAANAIIRPGISTADLEAAVDEVHKKYGVYSPFKNYAPGGVSPYPSSITVSVNEELVHGIPGKRKLKSGDIVSIDCGTVYDGFVGDSAFTTGVGTISAEAEKLLDVTEQALYVGISQMVSGNRSGDVSAAIQNYVESQGLYVTRVYTGHGVGRQMHEGPQVPNYGIPGRGVKLRSGMTIALEPMVLVGTPATMVLKDQWTVISQDHSLTAHFEHTVAITDNGPWILTQLEDGSSPAQITGHLREEVL